ncbi:site-specific integrase [Rhodococcus qingshengii]|uniref:tyrosine-type recombinase/integrase n=1 Tax=Rhodococcus qingshengii TaxID=334542 RepID=UPI001AE8B3FB|nr:tyrosine-type recombinase/integrase [Rhodococcus qingshengii]MBP1053060.1 site-specific integrase [Rhodococcus qingshengii]
MARRSRRAGKGSITSYKTNAGVRWRYQLWVPIDPEQPDNGDRQTGKAGFATAEDADNALTDAKNQLKNRIKFVRTAPTITAFIDQWITGLQLEASTIAGYKRLAKNHVKPELGTLALDKVTATRLAAHYKHLRTEGRKDAGHLGEPLSANTVNKVHVLIGAMLDAAKDDGYIAVNPARKAGIVKAPTGRQIKAAKPEMLTWTREQLAAFLAWNRNELEDDYYPLWHLIAYTGMRRSEALALRWADIDQASGRVSIRRALDTTARGTVKLTKTGGARVVNLDKNTLDVLKSYRAKRGAVALSLAGGTGYVFGNLDGTSRQPKAITKAWGLRMGWAKAALGEDVLPHMTLKGLRHTHASLLLEAGEHPKVVQERLGHSTITTTMDIYSHVSPTMQREAADRFAALVQ